MGLLVWWTGREQGEEEERSLKHSDEENQSKMEDRTPRKSSPFNEDASVVFVPIGVPNRCSVPTGVAKFMSTSILGSETKERDNADRKEASSAAGSPLSLEEALPWPMSQQANWRPKVNPRHHCPLEHSPSANGYIQCPRQHYPGSKNSTYYSLKYCPDYKDCINRLHQHCPDFNDSFHSPHQQCPWSNNCIHRPQQHCFESNDSIYCHHQHCLVSDGSKNSRSSAQTQLGLLNLVLNPAISHFLNHIGAVFILNTLRDPKYCRILKRNRNLIFKDNSKILMLTVVVSIISTILRENLYPYRRSGK